MTTSPLNTYIATFIINPNVLTDSVEDFTKEIQEQLKKINVSSELNANLGTLDFARIKDKRFPKGIYLQFTLKGNVSTPQKTQGLFTLNKTVHYIFIQKNHSIN